MNDQRIPGDGAVGDAAVSTLPAGFESAERFVGEWVLADSRARAEKRQACGMSEIRGFYDAMLPLADAALEYLGRHTPDALPPDGLNLLKLMLSLAEISTAVEWYGSATVPDSFSFTRFELIRQIPDEAAQT